MPIAVELLLRIVVSLVSLSSALTGAIAPDGIARPAALQACFVNRSDQNGCDPVNLMFPGANWEQVRDALRDAGWTTAGFGSRQVFDIGLEGVVPEAEQVFLADSGDTRFHIRLWQGPGLVTYASVHHEVDDLAGLTHRIDADWRPPRRSWRRGSARQHAPVPKPRSMRARTSYRVATANGAAGQTMRASRSLCCPRCFRPPGYFTRHLSGSGAGVLLYEAY